MPVDVTPGLGKREFSVFLNRARSGDPETIARLYKRYAGVVYTVAYYLVHSQMDAEDVVQNIFLDLPNALRKYEGRGNLGAWIRKVAVRAALIKLRSDRRRAEMSLDELPQDARTDPPLRYCERVTLEEALKSLPTSFRVVFVLKESEGYSHSEIAVMLGITSGASRMRLHRARELLRRVIGDER